uniref:E3 ubiquitin-protein ligase RMA n=1 Tax=Anthurium amnicola TaxID=1678845 RepID=A0A1D1Y950_9ARAE
MDLDLCLGPPRPAPRPPRLDLGSDLALGSPAGRPPPTFPATSSSSTEESRAPSPEPPSMAPLHAPPYSPSCASFSDPTDHPPPLSAAGGEASPPLGYSPSYQSLGPPYAPITPPAPTPFVPPRGQDALYSASYARAQGSDEGFLQGGSRAGLRRPYDPPEPPTALVEEGTWAGGGGGGGGGALPYSPPYVPLSMIPEDREELAYTRRRVFLDSPDDALAREEDGSSSRHSGFHLRGLIPLQRPRPYRLPIYYGDEWPTSPRRVDALDLPAHAEAAAEAPRKNKAGEQGLPDAGPEERSASAVNFECNICLELAKEPVVTTCGHLFCWPCLYQWLHLHCSYNECPVCKGEVMESDITPIYGRGSTTQSGLVLDKEAEDGDSGLKIPPRPRGRRSESWRQRIQRPISRGFGVEVTNSWRRLLGEEIHIGNMIEGDGDTSLPQIMGVESTLVARTRVGENMENGFFSVARLLPSRSSSSNPQSDSSTRSILRGGFEEIWARISPNSLDRGASLGATAAGPSRLLARTDGSTNLAGASAPLLNTDNPGGSILMRPPIGSNQGVGQASASSTMAMIQGDAGSADAAAEPNSAGSSRHPRIRGRSTGSLYIDECSIHACKRRRS